MGRGDYSMNIGYLSIVNDLLLSVKLCQNYILKLTIVLSVIVSHVHSFIHSFRSGNDTGWKGALASLGASMELYHQEGLGDLTCGGPKITSHRCKSIILDKWLEYNFKRTTTCSWSFIWHSPPPRLSLCGQQGKVLMMRVKVGKIIIASHWQSVTYTRCQLYI